MIRAFSFWKWAAVVLVLGLISLGANADQSPSHLDLGMQALDRQDWDTALSEFSRAIEAESENAMGYRGRGFAYTKMGCWHQAIADLNKTLELDSTQVNPYHNRAVCYFELADWERAIADLDQVIQLKPAWPIIFAKRGVVFRMRKQYAQAIADFDEAIRLSPESPCFYEMRGVARLESGDMQGGAADLEAGLQRNPGDLVHGFEAWPKTSVSDADLEHGELQLRLMLKDRPAMAQYGEDANLLYQWAIRKFAGEDLGHRVVWDPREPPRGVAAASDAPPAEPAFIRLAKNMPDLPIHENTRSFQSLWKDAVFELYNVSHAKVFEQLEAQADSGEISRTEFVNRKLKCELLAAEKCRCFFIRIFLRWCREHSESAQPGLWFVGRRLEPGESLVSDFQFPSRLRCLYGRQYDWRVLNSLWETADFEKASDLAGEMLEQPAENMEEEIMLRWRYGCCLLKANRPWAASVAFDELARLVPEDIDVYLCRAVAHRMLLDTERALADCNKAVEIDPLNPKAYWVRSRIYQAIGEDERAVADLKKLASLVPTANPNDVPLEFFDGVLPTE